MQSFRRGLKRKEPGEDGGEGYQAGLTQFQAAARKRESVRLKLQMGAAPGVLEKDLGEKVRVEESVCKGIAKFLAACKSETPCLEASKNLLLGQLRVDMLRFELNKLRRGRGSPARKQGNPSYAAVSLSDLRVPLLWRPADHLKDTGDSRRFALFLIARVGAQIYDTGLVYPVDRHSTDITWGDVLLFSKMPPYFELKLELYSFLLSDQSMEAGTAKLVRQAKSLSRAVGKRIARTLKNSSGTDNEDNLARERRVAGPKFDLLATATLRLEEAGEEVATHELEMEEGENSSERLPPLFGHFCCRLAVQPYCREEAVLAGSLGVRRGEEGRWQEDCWVRLMDWKLSLWSSVEMFEEARSPGRVVRVDQDTKVKSGTSAEGDTLTLENYGEPVVEVRCPTKEVKAQWLATLYQHACDHRRWRQAAQERMEVLSPDTRPGQVRSVGRTRSKLLLHYNETKI